MMGKRVGAACPGVELTVHIHYDRWIIASVQAYRPSTNALVLTAEEQQITRDQIMWAATSRIPGRFSEVRNVDRGIVVAVLK